jgi:hypothetical protein
VPGLTQPDSPGADRARMRMMGMDPGMQKQPAMTKEPGMKMQKPPAMQPMDSGG